MSDQYLGEIRAFAGNFAPVGWALCKGQLLDISSNSTLFALIGTTYGGDGVTNFALPDLQGRAPMNRGQLNITGTNYDIGSSGGAETVTLTINQLPKHSHVPVGSSEATDVDPTNKLWAVTASNSYADPISKTPPPPTVNMNAATVAAVGGNLPHDNMQPFLTISYIIAVEGIYPSFS